MIMHIMLAVIAIIGLVLFLRWQHQKQRSPALPAPMSPFEREISTREFDEMVLATSHQTPVLVDFYAPWCGPCHQFAPLLAELAHDYKGAFLLARINYDKSRDLVTRYQVDCVPTLILFRNGQKTEHIEGTQLPHQLRYFLAKNGVLKV